MDPNLEFFLKTLTKKFDTINGQLGQMRKELGQVKDHVGTLEETPMTPTEPESLRSIPRGPRVHHHEFTTEYNSRRLHHDFIEEAHRIHAEPESPSPPPLGPRAQCHDLTPEYNPRYPYQDFVDQEERVFRSNRPYAPTFDGNPEVYVDWEEKMDQYFEFDEMSEVTKCQFAKSKLVRHAKAYWGEVERKSYYSGDKINTWREMKSKLREKYLGKYYEQKLLDQWYKLRQDDTTVSDYIAKFNEYIRRRSIVESEAMIISRFRAGLRKDI